MAASISTRESIRWGSGDPSEPTDTLVISGKRWYLDLRISVRDPGRLDWALAGERIQVDGASTIKFTHEIDSRGQFDEVDQGDFVDLGGDRSREIGRMHNLDSGKQEPYEEIWRQLHVERDTKLLMTRSVGSDQQVYTAHAGDHYLALSQKAGKEVSYLRAQKSNTWHILYQGGEELPLIFAQDQKLGESFNGYGRTWEVLESL